MFFQEVSLSTTLKSSLRLTYIQFLKKADSACLGPQEFIAALNATPALGAKALGLRRPRRFFAFENIKSSPSPLDSRLAKIYLAQQDRNRPCEDYVIGVITSLPSCGPHCFWLQHLIGICVGVENVTWSRIAGRSYRAVRRLIRVAARPNRPRTCHQALPTRRLVMQASLRRAMPHDNTHWISINSGMAQGTSDPTRGNVIWRGEVGSISCYSGHPWPE